MTARDKGTRMNAIRIKPAADGWSIAVRLRSGHVGRIEPAQWRDPDGPASSTARAPATISGYRTACVLRRMARRGGGRITEEHLIAVEKTRAAWEVGYYGFTPGGYGLPEAGYVAAAPGPRSGPSAATEAQAAHWRRFLRAAAVVPLGLAELFAWAVVGNRDIATWCVRMEARHPGQRFHAATETGRLLVLLDLLATHFADEIREDRLHGRLPA